MFFPIVQGGHSAGGGELILDITSNTSNVNILTLATAAGYNASTDTTPIIVNVAAGVNVTGSGTYAMRTGALNKDSNLTINVASTAFITGYTGTQGATGTVCGPANGQPGTAGGDSIYWETTTGGSGVYSVVNDGTIRSGGGGGGGGGAAGRGGSQDKGTCTNTYYGSTGSTGANGGYGQNGANGGSGTNAPVAQCNYCAPGSGGAGGAAGYAVRKNGRTVTTSGSGTYTGSTA